MTDTAYPADLETWMTLGNGDRIFVRPIRPDDAAALRSELDRADRETLYQRFFTPTPRIDARTVDYLTRVDYRRRLALAAFSDEGEPIAIARYEALHGAPGAEVAVVVKSEWRRLGIARTLLQRVVERARAAGFAHVEAVCLDGNEAIIALLENMGFAFGAVEDGLVVGRLDLSA